MFKVGGGSTDYFYYTTVSLSQWQHIQSSNKTDSKQNITSFD